MAIVERRAVELANALEPAAGARQELGVLTSLAIGVTVVAALSIGRDVLVPIALAILLSFMLAPGVRLLRRARLGRVPAVFFAAVLTLAVILTLGGLIGLQMSQLISAVPGYVRTIDEKVRSVRSVVTQNMSGVVGAFDHLPETTSEPRRPLANETRAAPEDGKPLRVEMQQPDLTPLEFVERVIGPVMTPLAMTGAVFIVAIFILLQQTDLRDRFIRLFGLQDLHQTTRALDDAARRLSRYLLAQLGLNATFGLVIGIGLWLIGIPNPPLWATLAALFRFVPYVGSTLSALLPIALAAAVDPGWGTVGYTAALFVVTQLVMSQFVDPLAYGRSTGLSPLSVVIATIFWAWMWGPIGLILSMPLTVCLVVLGRHVQRLEFLDVLMGDRPALTLVESFYRRILSKDPDEALDYAETLLKDRSLSTYYDEVAVKGLLLAMNDVERGALSAPLLARVQTSMGRLIDELGGFDDSLPTSAKRRADLTSGLDAPENETAPTPAESEGIDPEGEQLTGVWSAAAPVLCIAGGGPLDAAVAAMTAQLLIKNGLGARVIPFAAASREAIGLLEVAESAMVCVCYLDMTDAPSQLRYLVRRVRKILPDSPILVGLSPIDDPQAGSDRLRTTINADYYADSLRETVNICLTRARADRPARPAAPEILIVKET